MQTKAGHFMKIQQFFQSFAGHSLTYDDLIFLPGYLDFGIEQIDISTKLTKKISLNIPLISSPMDTVTEAELATALALQGGIGIIHYNMSPDEQLHEVQKVKRFQNGFISDPITLPPHASIRDVVRIRQQLGYSIIPITDDGTSRGKLVGMITKYDYSRFLEGWLDKKISERMVPLEKLPHATYADFARQGGFDLCRANQRLLESHSAALPIVDREGSLLYLITRSDLEKHQNFPNAATDEKGALLVGAAVETWAEKAHERIARLSDVVDVILFDTSQGHSRYECDLIRWTKRHHPHLEVIAGNVVTGEGCHALIDAGADAVRIGMGSGSICTTQEVGGIGRGQASAIFECANFCRSRNVPLIADGGITKSSDIVKALVLGASTVMLGSLLACTNEAPGKSHIKDGIRLKEYRGMGSIKAMEKGSAIRYGTENSTIRIPEGVSGLVPSRGSVGEWIMCLLQGTRQGLHKIAYPTIHAAHLGIEENSTRLERRSEGAKREGQVHNLYEIAQEGTQIAQTPSEKEWAHA